MAVRLGSTVMVTLAVPVQPFSVAVTVYVVVAAGFTVIVDPDCPVLQT